MHNLALALHRQGAHVTGTDDEIFEPARGRLAAAGLLPSQEGWDPARITPELDAVIVGMHARPDNPLYQAYAPTLFHSQAAIAQFNNVITRQASMLSYIDDFRLMLAITVLCAPLILLMRTPKATGGETIHVAAD